MPSSTKKMFIPQSIWLAGLCVGSKLHHLPSALLANEKKLDRQRRISQPDDRVFVCSTLDFLDSHIKKLTTVNVWPVPRKMSAVTIRETLVHVLGLQTARVVSAGMRWDRTLSKDQEERVPCVIFGSDLP